MPPNDRCPGTNLPSSVKPAVVGWGDHFIYGLEAGSGSKVVVLVHGSGSRGACVWTSEIPWLAAAGFRVLAVDMPCVRNSTCPSGPERPLAALTAVATHFTESDPTAKVAVVAASAGGPVAFHLASQPGSEIAATVALSPAGIESGFSENGTPTTTLDAARSLRIPTLVVASPDDATVDQPTLERITTTAPTQLARVEILPGGSGHAQEVLYDAADGTKPSAFRGRFVAFLNEELG